MFRHNFYILLLVISPLSLQAGETITFNGDPSMLGTAPLPITSNNSLFPSLGGTDSNTVIVSSGNILGDVFGGLSGTGADVTGNQVIMHNGFVGENIFGGWSGDNTPATVGKTANNSVSIYGGTVTKEIYGGYGIDAVGNSINIYGGNIGSAGSSLYGGYGVVGATGAVSGNIINISGGNVYSRNIIGGLNDDGDTFGNAVNISGGNITLRSGNIYGGQLTVSAGDAYNNIVTISGGVIGGVDTGANGNIFGGSSILGNTYNNTVKLSGGFMWGLVAGMDRGSTAWQSAGNNLIVDGTATVGGIGNFENAFITGNLNVIGDRYAATFVNGGYSAQFNNLHNDGALTFFNMQYDGLAPNITGLDQNAAKFLGSYTGSGYIGLDVRIRPDASQTDADRIEFDNVPAQRVTLGFLPTSNSIAAVNEPVLIATINNGAYDQAFTTKDPGFGVYAYEIIRNGNNYYLALTDKYAGELGKVYSEAATAVLAQTSRTPDLLLRNVLNASIDKADEKGTAVFVDIAYEKERISTGSHVDIEGAYGLVALAFNRGGHFSSGVFGEFTDGRYKTKNKATTNLNTFNVRAHGDAHSEGIGTFLQYRENPKLKASNGMPLGLRLEASVRAGSLTMDFNNSKLLYDVDFKRRGMYLGTTLGGAYAIQKTPNISLELYGHGIWTRLQGKSVKDKLGQRISFSAADSLRLLSGVRLDYAYNEKLRPFVGLGIDIETMGKPKVNINGLKAKTAKSTGASGVLELGTRVNNSDNVKIDAKAITSFGKRRGIGGVLQVKYEF